MNRAQVSSAERAIGSASSPEYMRANDSFVTFAVF